MQLTPLPHVHSLASYERTVGAAIIARSVIVPVFNPLASKHGQSRSYSNVFFVPSGCGTSVNVSASASLHSGYNDLHFSTVTKFVPSPKQPTPYGPESSRCARRTRPSAATFVLEILPLPVHDVRPDVANFRRVRTRLRIQTVIPSVEMVIARVSAARADASAIRVIRLNVRKRPRDRIVTQFPDFTFRQAEI